MTDPKFEELLNAFERATLEFHSYLSPGGIRRIEEEEERSNAARSALVAYFEEITKDVAIKAIITDKTVHYVQKVKAIPIVISHKEIPNGDS